MSLAFPLIRPVLYLSKLRRVFRVFQALYRSRSLPSSSAKCRSRKKTLMMTVMDKDRSERGMTLLAVMGIMTVMAIGLLAIAPSIQEEIQRQKELETIARGEEVAEAIRQYVEFYRGAKLPNSMKDLLDGLPYGTKKR